MGTGDVHILTRKRVAVIYSKWFSIPFVTRQPVVAVFLARPNGKVFETLV